MWTCSHRGHAAPAACNLSATRSLYASARPNTCSTAQAHCQHKHLQSASGICFIRDVPAIIAHRWRKVFELSHRLTHLSHHHPYKHFLYTGGAAGAGRGGGGGGERRRAAGRTAPRRAGPPRRGDVRAVAHLPGEDRGMRPAPQQLHALHTVELSSRVGDACMWS